VYHIFLRNFFSFLFFVENLIKRLLRLACFLGVLGVERNAVAKSAQFAQLVRNLCQIQASEAESSES